MTEKVHIDKFPEKVKLVLENHTTIKTQVELARRMAVTKDYVSRVINGSRGLTRDVLQQMSKALGVSEALWQLPLPSLGLKLGYSRRQLADITGLTISGFDFQARLRDGQLIRRLFALIGGYWESYYYSVSRSDALVASRDLVYFGEPDEDDIIPCTVTDAFFTYTGWCFPVQHHLYMLLEKDRLHNEIIVYMLNMPQRFPPRLEGIILCKSDGGDAFSSIPCAAKVGLRLLGTPEELRQSLNIPEGDDLRKALAQRVAGYVSKEELELDEQKQLLSRLSNAIGTEDLPNALRMTFGS